MSKKKRPSNPHHIKRWAINLLTWRDIPLPAGKAGWWSVKDAEIAKLLFGEGRERLDAEYAAAHPKRKDKTPWQEIVSGVRAEMTEQKKINAVLKESRVLKNVIDSRSSKAFLSTYEWRRVRMEALKKYGARCQCCGASPETGAVMNVDHIKPRKLFPQLALDVNNLQILCDVCNHGKGNWDMTDWRETNDKRGEHAAT